METLTDQSFFAAYVSIQRLEQFFEEPEVDSWVSALQEEGAVSTTNQFESIGISGGTFKYSEEAASKSDSKKAQDSEVNGGEVETVEPEFELRDIDVSFPTGKLSLVAGATGSGKSSLFLALLGGELSVSHPSLDLRTDVDR